MEESANQGPSEISVDQEIGDVSMGKPHFLLLGAGASRAALPDGDANGRPIPLLRDIAVDFDLSKLFPGELRDLAMSDFEAAFSKLVDVQHENVSELEQSIAGYFLELELPSKPNCYDLLHLCLRDKDAIFTFNWDPFLIQSRIRLARLGVTSFPKLFFLHGNVMIGFCRRDQNSGLVGQRCSHCGGPFAPSRLLFPVAKKDYQGGDFIEREWSAAKAYLENSFMLTVFGYSAPKTDVEAVSLLKAGWGDIEDRDMEQTEIINRPDSNHEELREKWKPFIHTHHYEIHESFYDSWLAKHPRRSGEAYWNQYWEARFVSNNTIPALSSFGSLEELVDWFRPLMEAENS